MQLFPLLFPVISYVTTCLSSLGTVETLDLRQNIGQGCSSVGRASDWHATEAGLIPQRGKGSFSWSQLSLQTLLQCSYSPRVQSHALTPVRVLKIPSIGSHTFGTHTLLEMGSTGLAAARTLPR